MTSKEYSNQHYLFRLTFTWSAPISTQERKYVKCYVFFSVSSRFKFRRAQNIIHFGFIFLSIQQEVICKWEHWNESLIQAVVPRSAISIALFIKKWTTRKLFFHFVSYRFVMKSVSATRWFIIVSLKYGMHYWLFYDWSRLHKRL